MKQNNFNLVTEYWYGYPITYDKNKYAYEIVNKQKGDFRFFDKETNETIVYSTYITRLDQISENEFIVLHNESPVLDYNFLFEHLYYDKKTKKTEKVFTHEYKAKYVITQARNINETYILDSCNETTIYNSKTRESLNLENLDIDNNTYTDDQGNQYLIGEATITTDEVFPTYEDVITMYINADTLKFNGFCSRIQGERFIPIIQNKENEFIENYNNTVEEVLKYLILLEEQEEYLKEQSSKRARNILMKKL